MSLLVLVALPMLTGLGIWCLGDSRSTARNVVAIVGVAATLLVTIAAVTGQPTWRFRWGAGLTLVFEVDPISRVPILLVPFVALAVVTYALTYGELRGRSRMVGLLVIFVGSMELLLVAGDLLTLIIGWELVGFVSWALIAHEWRTDAPDDAAHAFIVTRTGDLGLFLAAGAAFAVSGSLSFADLPALGNEGGSVAHVFVAGVVIAAFTKSAQFPFSPWLFSAMSGPTPASALLHSATMVAAGAYLLARLQPDLDVVTWFAPLTIAIGVTTALAGGIVAALHPEAKKLLAASTSAHYGFMIVAVGAGYPAVAIAHLLAHGLFKALLFISAGVAIDASGSTRLADMRLGRSHRTLAVLVAVAIVALAGIPPLGAAWTKEAVVAAASHEALPIGLLVVVAGGLSAFYAIRFQLVAFGPPSPLGPQRRDSGTETTDARVRRRSTRGRAPGCRTHPIAVELRRCSGPPRCWRSDPSCCRWCGCRGVRIGSGW